MLMSWYMAGYHAGHYQGLKLAAASAHKQNKSKKSSWRLCNSVSCTLFGNISLFCFNFFLSFLYIKWKCYLSFLGALFNWDLIVYPGTWRGIFWSPSFMEVFDRLLFFSLKIQFLRCKILNFLVIKTRHLDPNPHWPKMLDPDPQGNQCGSTTLTWKFVTNARIKRKIFTSTVPAVRWACLPWPAWWAGCRTPRTAPAQPPSSSPCSHSGSSGRWGGGGGDSG